MTDERQTEMTDMQTLAADWEQTKQGLNGDMFRLAQLDERVAKHTNSLRNRLIKQERKKGGGIRMIDEVYKWIIYGEPLSEEAREWAEPAELNRGIRNERIRETFRGYEDKLSGFRKYSRPLEGRYSLEVVLKEVARLCYCSPMTVKRVLFPNCRRGEWYKIRECAG